MLVLAIVATAIVVPLLFWIGKTTITTSGYKCVREGISRLKTKGLIFKSSVRLPCHFAI